MLARHRPAAVAAAALASLTLAGCGSGGSVSALSASGAAVMYSHLNKIASAVSAHDQASARTELDAFAADVAREKSSGHLTGASYAALETAIARTRAQIAVEVVRPAASSPAPTTTVMPPVTVAAPGPPSVDSTPAKGGADQVKRKGQGHGHGKDNGSSKGRD